MQVSKVKPQKGVFLLLGLLLSISFLIMSIPKTWQEATQKNEEGELSLSKSWAESVGKKVEQHQQHELYMLVATRDGNYLCKHCLSAQFFLRAGEVYRYGTTGLGQDGRGYSDEWLNRYQLNYITISNGDLATIKIQEAVLIGNYVLLPENTSRPLQSTLEAKPYWYRLVLPPGNNSLD